MKQTLLIATLLASSPATLALLGRSKSSPLLSSPLPSNETAADELSFDVPAEPAFNEWGNSKLERWLQDHNVPNPGNLNADQLQKLVKENYDSVYDTWNSADFSSYASKNGIPLPTGQSTTQKYKKAIQRSFDDSVDSWSDSELKEWLDDHGIPLPPKPKHEQLLNSVKAHLSSASNYVSGGYSSQKVFQKNADKTFESWEDSQLRQYLLDQGVVSPSSKREELVVQVRKYYNDAAAGARSASASASSAAAQATGGSYFGSGDSTFSNIIPTDAPKVAYDYLSDTYNDATDYVWSAYEGDALRKWAVEKGLIKGQTETKRDELVKLVRDSYAETVDNVYEAWSDNRLRDWAVKHGIVKGKTATTRDELLDIVSRNYYGARDTTYNAWSDNQLRSWLESRGIIQSGTEKKRDDLLSLVADNYYSLRDRAYETWDDATLRSYLSSQGAAASSYADSVQRSDLVKNVREYYYSTQDKVYDTWSDKDIRKWLERNGVVKSKKAETMRRDKLEEALESSWKGARENVEKTWKETEMRQWLVSNGWIKSDAQVKYDDLVKLFSTKYSQTTDKASEWGTWSDNRIRGWLRGHGIEVPMATERQELEQRMKENYVSTQGLLASIQSYLSSGQKFAEHQVEEAIQLLRGAVGKADPNEAGLKGAARTASRSIVSATASLKQEL